MSKMTAHSKEVAAVMLFRQDGALLMQHRDDKPGLPYADQWSIPSGLKEAFETPEECARRELAEETGYQCARLEPLVVMEDRDDTQADYLLTIFSARYDGKQILKCLEGQALEFIARDKAVSYRMPPFILNVWDRVLKGFPRG